MFNGAIIAVDMSSGMKFKEKVGIRKLIIDNGGHMAFNISREVSKKCLININEQCFPYRILIERNFSFDVIFSSRV